MLEFCVGKILNETIPKTISNATFVKCGRKFVAPVFLHCLNCAANRSIKILLFLLQI